MASRWLVVAVSALALAIALGPGCGGTVADNRSRASDSSDGDPDAGVDGCAEAKVMQYAYPGCGNDAAGVCGFSGQDGCAIKICSCNGQTIIKCDWASEPWSDYGPCDAGIADADAQGDIGVDGCAAPNVMKYASSGCGNEAVGVCGDNSQDACAIPVCSCSGETIIKCDWAYEPWSDYGPCDATDN